MLRDCISDVNHLFLVRDSGPSSGSRDIAGCVTSTENDLRRLSRSKPNPQGDGLLHLHVIEPESGHRPELLPTTAYGGGAGRFYHCCAAYTVVYSKALITRACGLPCTIFRLLSTHPERPSLNAAILATAVSREAFPSF